MVQVDKTKKLMGLYVKNCHKYGIYRIHVKSLQYFNMYAIYTCTSTFFFKKRTQCTKIKEYQDIIKI